MSRWIIPWHARLERIGDLNREFQHLFERQRPTRNAVLQRFAVEKFHGNEMLAVLLADVMNCADVRMIQCGRGLRFAAESFERRRVVEHFSRQEFQSNGAMESVSSAL